MAKNINVILSLQDRFTTKMSQASVATLQFKRNLAIAQVASDKMATVMHKMETAAAVGVTAAATATTAAVKTSLDAYEEFNKSINNVAGVKGISTVSEEFKNLTEAAKEASKNVKGTTYKDAADSLYYMSLAGWNTTQSLNAIEPVLKAVRISGQDTKTVADALTDSMTALGLSSEQAAEYVDIATSVQSASNTDMLQLQNALIKSGAGMESLYRRYADTMGEAAGKMQAAKDTMAIVGALSSAGIKDSKAGTVINSLFTRFVNKLFITVPALLSLIPAELNAPTIAIVSFAACIFPAASPIVSAYLLYKLSIPAPDLIKAFCNCNISVLLALCTEVAISTYSAACSEESPKAVIESVNASATVFVSCPLILTAFNTGSIAFKLCVVFQPASDI